jgi:DNA-binding transcriptional LysR family regulator
MRGASGGIEDSEWPSRNIEAWSRIIENYASTTPGMYVVPRLIAKFRSQHPRIAIRLGIKNTRQIEEGLINNEFDLGFVGGHLVGEEIETLSWRSDELVLIVPPSHPLAHRRQIKPRDLGKETFINREPGSATRAVVEEHFLLPGLPPEASLELGNPETVKLAVKDGMGIAFVSKSAIEMELETKSLVALKVQGLRISRELKIIYRKGRHLSRAANALIEMAQQL